MAIVIKEGEIYKTCETCNGTCEVIRMVCYGGQPSEEIGECPDCNGYGFILMEKQEMNDGKYEVRLTIEEYKKIKGSYVVAKTCSNCSHNKAFEIPKGMKYSELQEKETLCEQCEAAHYKN